LSIENLSKRYGWNLALDSVNLSMENGSMLGLIGPNGAGKTTLLKTVVGIILPDEGKVCLDGEDLYRKPSLKQRLGYVGEYPDYYPSYRVIDMVNFYRMTYSSWSQERYEELSAQFILPEGQRIKALSRGMKTQLALLLNMSIMPRLLLLDEPTSGLDPIVKKRVLNAIVDHVAAYDTKVLMATHNLAQIERVCDHVAIIEGGRILFCEQVHELKQRVKKLQVIFASGFPEELRSHPDLLSLEQLGRVYTLVTRSGELVAKLRQCNPVVLDDLDISLEEVFIHEVGGQSA
jgi:ABC-2 type transport system ATP-binding protein